MRFSARGGAKGYGWFKDTPQTSAGTLRQMGQNSTPAQTVIISRRNHRGPWPWVFFRRGRAPRQKPVTRDFGEIHIRHVGQRGSPAKHVPEISVSVIKPSMGRPGRYLGSIHQVCHILHTDIFEADILDTCPFLLVAGHRVSGLDSLRHQIDADEGRGISAR